jgi:3,2-trans-enoyl-CoA isomerase
MGFILQERDGEIMTLTLKRGKVNALNDSVVDELRDILKTCETDSRVRALVLTGEGKFFSFGFDIPEFLSFTKEAFARYLTNFTDLYTYLFLYPKPVVAALNGHTIAGGCMLSLACDYRVMVTGKARISLNEIGFGSSVFAGSTEMLRFLVGSANATEILYSGALYTAEEAKSLGLVQKVAPVERCGSEAGQVALNFSEKSQEAFASIKSLLRKSVTEEMIRREGESLKEFVDIWYSEATWANLQNIKIT